MDLEGLGGLTMHVILSKLAPQDAASVACVSKRFRNWSSDELLWSRFCADDLDLSSPLDPLGNPMPSFKWIGTYTGSESWGVLLDHFYERKAPKHYLLFQLRWNNALNQRMMENIKV
ncbi:F-box protein skip16 [Datura stramonium]|uniref:F-box protein skip16 n=1 Tax=Datura stramonium TaxID=4076 RepID=A0ABS8VFV5_DATST|nr:F-box protein skip16 [Datura stramonium]